jgi:beta-fructofuranosidase
VAGNPHWGHATSKDLYHWENQPIAIFPDAKDNGIFSGSSVIDVNNTSGFFPDQNDGVVAIYTLHTPKEQTQEIAYSKDGGYTFTKYSQNPVISIGSTQFRDPKVIWHDETQSWVMVIAYAQELVIGIYTSPDLKDWTHASNFTKAGLLGIQYECPNLVEIPLLKNVSIENPLDSSNFASTGSLYVLAISINPGAPLGGSITQYFPGHFNGTHFTPVDAAARIADFGKDNYAGQFFYGIPPTAPQISIAWASNWQYSQVVPTGQLENFRSTMTLPRYNVLANTERGPYTLVSLPYDLSSLYSSTYSLANTTKPNSSVLYDYSSTVPSGALYFSMKISSIPLANTIGTANFTFLSSATGESVRGGFFLGGDTPFFIDRGHIRGFDDPFFTDKFSTNNLINKDTQTFRLQGVIDRSILEVFLDNGLRSGTATFFPHGELDTVIIATAGLNPGVKVEIGVWGLVSAWQSQQNVNGTVEGNVTTRSYADQKVKRNNLAHLVY